jgi:hypothetical protein
MILAQPFHARYYGMALAVASGAVAERCHATNAALFLDDRRYLALVTLERKQPRRLLEMAG